MLSWGWSDEKSSDYDQSWAGANLSFTSQQPGLCQDILIIKDELVSWLAFTPGL